MNLVHYCSTDAFFSILQNRTIRLSPVRRSNDAFEGLSYSEHFRAVAEELGIPKSLIDVSLTFLLTAPDSAEAFVFCLSEEIDLLSQWRAYAQDGGGFGIEFDSKILTQDYGKTNFGKQYFELKPIDYDKTSLRNSTLQLASKIAAISEDFGEFIKLRNDLSPESAAELMRNLDLENQDRKGAIISTGPREAYQQLLSVINGSMFNGYHFKRQHFAEEREHRIIRYIPPNNNLETGFQVSGVEIKPFIDCSFPKETNGGIVRIWAGPKNPTPTRWLRSFLNKRGYEDVEIKLSNVKGYR